MRPDVVNCMVRRSYGKMKYWPQVRLLMILVVIVIGSSSLIAAEQFDRQVYRLINKKSGLCLALGNAGSTEPWTPIVQYGCGGQSDHEVDSV